MKISDKLHSAALAADNYIHKWISDGKIDVKELPSGCGCCNVLHNLLGFEGEGLMSSYDCFTDDHTPILEALVGEHGWTVYCMLKARQDAKA